MIRCALLVLALGCCGAGEEPLRFIDGVAAGGPGRVASAMQWVAEHYLGAANRETFTAATAKRLEYLASLVDAGGPVVWVDRLVLEAPGLVPAECLILADGEGVRRAASVEAWFSQGKEAQGAAAFSLGSEGTGSGFVQRSRRDLPADRVRDFGELQAIEARISPVVSRRLVQGQMVFDVDAWTLYMREGGSLMAGQQRSLRLGSLVTGLLQRSDAAWACAVVSGFPAASDAAQAHLLSGWLATRWRTRAGERLWLMQPHIGEAGTVNTLHLAVVSEAGGKRRREGFALAWSGADWQSTPLWEVVSPIAAARLPAAP